MSVELDKKTCETIGCHAPATHVLTWRDRDTGAEYTENVCEEDGMMYTHRPSLGATLAPMNAPVPQSGYTPCACRDCMDTCVTASQGGWTLCWECLEAGCTPLPPASGEWPGRRPEGEYECQRDDAYGDSVGDAGTGHGSYEYRSGC
jgi:hypothetical protein